MTPELQTQLSYITVGLGILALAISGPAFLVGFLRTDEKLLAGQSKPRSTANVLGFVCIIGAASMFLTNYFLA